MRYVLTQPENVQKRFRTVEGIVGGKPNYNLRPGEKVPIVVRNVQGERHLQSALLGFMPPWASTSQRELFPFARAEDIQAKPTFRDAFATTRCLIPADGFYVWDEKKPYFVKMTGHKLFGVAGIYSINRNFRPALISFAALSTWPNGLVADVHHRQPVIIRPEDETRFVDPTTPIAEIETLTLPLDEDGMEMYRVSSRVSAAKYSSRTFIVPWDGVDEAEEDEPAQQLGFFE